MRRLALLLLTVLLPAAAFATGFGGADNPTRIPVPARVFSATVEDNAGTQVKVDKVTFDGEVFLFGKVGEGQAAVPFEKIEEVRFEPTGETGTRIAFVKLREGDSVRLVVESDLPCYGASAFGNYRIEVKDIRVVRVNATPPTP